MLASNAVIVSCQNSATKIHSFTVTQTQSGVKSFSTSGWKKVPADRLGQLHGDTECRPVQRVTKKYEMDVKDALQANSSASATITTEQLKHAVSWSFPPSFSHSLCLCHQVSPEGSKKRPDVQ